MVASRVNYTDFMHVYNLNLMNPMLLGGLFIGAMMGFIFCALTIIEDAIYGISEHYAPLMLPESFFGGLLSMNAFEGALR